MSLSRVVLSFDSILYITERGCEREPVSSVNIQFSSVISPECERRIPIWNHLNSKNGSGIEPRSEHITGGGGNKAGGEHIHLHILGGGSIEAGGEHISGGGGIAIGSCSTHAASGIE